MPKKYKKSYRYALRFDEKVWGRIKEFYECNFSDTHAVITLRKDMGAIKEKLDYVYGYVKKNADNIKSIALFGQEEDMQVEMTLYTSKNTSPVSLKIEAENTDKYFMDKIKQATKNIKAVSRKFTVPYLIIKGVFDAEILILLYSVFVFIMMKKVGAALLALLAASPFWFIWSIFDYIIKRRETGDEWIQFWVDDEHIEKYRNIPGWRIWQYIIMGLIALLPFVVWFFLVR